MFRISLLRNSLKPRFYRHHSSHHSPNKWKYQETQGKRSWWRSGGTLVVLGVVGTVLTVSYQFNNRGIVGPWPVHVLSTLPLRAISRFFGWINSFDLPVPLRDPLLRLYATIFSVNLDEMEPGKQLSDYANLQEFFYRKLNPSARTLAQDFPLISPCDGKVLHFGKVTGNLVEQVKNVNYDLDLFLGPPSSSPDPINVEKAETGKISAMVGKHELWFLVIYLAPGDYHRFHSPCDWEINIRRHFPGDLYSVSPYLARKLPQLFVLNERVALLGRWKYGLFAFVPVGATNVGSIVINNDKTLCTNLKGKLKTPLGSYSEVGFEGWKVSVGEELGGFRLGSTVVLIFETFTTAGEVQWKIKPGQVVKLGDPLIDILPTTTATVTTATVTTATTTTTTTTTTTAAAAAAAAITTNLSNNNSNNSNYSNNVNK